MYKNPIENRTRVDHILLEQFLRKGYKCEEIHEQGATIFIITHDKKNTDAVTKVVAETYKELLRAN